MLRAAESRRRIDADRRRPLAFNSNAHRAQKAAKLDDVRFHRRMPDFRPALCRRGREQCGLRSGDRRLLLIERRSLQTVGSLERVAWLVEQPGAELDERLQMRRDRSPRGKVTTRLRQPRRSPAREQWTEKQHRTPELSDEHRIGTVRCHLAASDP
jgi:hypothetical protein